MIDSSPFRSQKNTRPKTPQVIKFCTFCLAGAADAFFLLVPQINAQYATMLEELRDKKRLADESTSGMGRIPIPFAGSTGMNSNRMRMFCRSNYFEDPQFI